MNKLQIQSAIFNLKMTIDLAKLYHNIENIIPEHRRRFEEIGENSRLILKYVEETGDLKIAKEVTSFVRGWLYYLHDNEDNLSPMMVSIKECCHNLLRISEALKAIEKDNSENKKIIILSQKEEEKEKQTPINISELKSCFKVSFLQEDHKTHVVYFDYLINDLKERWKPIDFARIALIIHESEKINTTMAPRDFSKWYEKFCKYVNCEYSSTNKPCKLKRGKGFDALKKRLYYL